MENAETQITVAVVKDGKRKKRFIIETDTRYPRLMVVGHVYVFNSQIVKMEYLQDDK